jgi:hypothetical protein
VIGDVLPDPRRHAYRAGLASESLRGKVEAARYVAGVRRRIGAPSLPLRREPRFDATLDTEGLFGETLTLFDESEGWAWVQLDRDGYVGYMPNEGLAATQFKPRLQNASACALEHEFARLSRGRRGKVPCSERRGLRHSGTHA